MNRFSCLGVALGLLVWAPTASAQEQSPSSARLVFSTLGVGGTTAPTDDPYESMYPSVSLDHVRTHGWRTLRVGGTVQGDVLGRDGYAEAHLGFGATTVSGLLILSATVGPSLGFGTRGVYGPNQVWPGRETLVRVATDEGAGVGLRASGQALVVVVPEIALGIEAAHDQNTFSPTSGARLLLSFGTHRRSLIRI